MQNIHDTPGLPKNGSSSQRMQNANETREKNLVTSLIRRAFFLKKQIHKSLLVAEQVISRMHGVFLPLDYTRLDCSELLDYNIKKPKRIGNSMLISD